MQLNYRMNANKRIENRYRADMKSLHYLTTMYVATWSDAILCMNTENHSAFVLLFKYSLCL